MIPATPTPLAEIMIALERIVPLQGLPREQLEWLAGRGVEVRVKGGEILFEEGEPAEHMMLILKGEIHVRRTHSGTMALFIGRSGQLTGLLPFSRMKGYGGQGFAAQDVWAILYHKSTFPELLEAVPSFGQRVVSTLLDRVREVTRIEQQSEKLTALGKLAGNLAHELNNPASAAQRASSGILTELRAVSEGRYRLVALCLTPEQVLAVQEWEREVRARALENQLADRASDQTLAVTSGPGPGPASDQVAVARREDEISSWIEHHGLSDAWQIAPELAEMGVEAIDLAPLTEFLQPSAIHVVLEQFASALRAEHYAQAMLNSTSRIFDLISAIKTYSYMDRAPILEIDVAAGLDATLQMLQSRMSNVNVIREYQPGLPTLSAYGSELNQVWTALIENALDAMALVDRTNLPKKNGCLRVTCSQEADLILVEVWNDGPDIPKDLQDRIFEPFFTTKAPGHGLGLGLDNAMRIVRKHRGHLGVRSEDGATCFRVRLPIDQLQAY
jgi:signal transduction histidine kinase